MDTPSTPVIIEEVELPVINQGKKRVRAESLLGALEPRKISRVEDTSLPDLFEGHLGLPTNWYNPEPWTGNDGAGGQSYEAIVEEEDQQQWRNENVGYQDQGAGEAAMGGHAMRMGGEAMGYIHMEYGPGDGYVGHDQGMSERVEGDGMGMEYRSEGGPNEDGYQDQVISEGIEGTERTSIEWVEGGWFDSNWFACYDEEDNDGAESDSDTESDLDSDDEEQTTPPIHLLDNSTLTDADLVKAVTIVYRGKVVEVQADLAALVVTKVEMEGRVRQRLLPDTIQQLNRPDVNVSKLFFGSVNRF